MKIINANWFIAKIAYDKVMEDGVEKRITESYCIEALSFTEAEERIIEEMSSYISGEFDMKAVAIAPFNEIVFSENTNDDKWYKVKLAFITINEKTGKEKCTSHMYLVQADSVRNALANIESAMQGSIIDYHIVSLTETNYVDVFRYNEKLKNNGISTDGRSESKT